MNDCIFCKITRGEIPSHTIFENEHVFAFLDIHPINPGHVLVVPKHHEPDFYKLDDALYTELWKVVKGLAKKVGDTMNPQKVGIVVAGWDVPHTHVHIVPMNDHHDITSKAVLEGKKASPTQEELAQVATKILG